MRRLVYLLAANQDLAGIVRYITRESGSLAISKAFAARLHDKCAKLAALPGTLGQARPELGRGHPQHILSELYDILPLSR